MIDTRLLGYELQGIGADGKVVKTVSEHNDSGLGSFRHYEAWAKAAEDLLQVPGVYTVLSKEIISVNLHRSY